MQLHLLNSKFFVFQSSAFLNVIKCMVKHFQFLTNKFVLEENKETTLAAVLVEHLFSWDMVIPIIRLVFEEILNFPKDYNITDITIYYFFIYRVNFQ